MVCVPCQPRPGTGLDDRLMLELSDANKFGSVRGRCFPIHGSLGVYISLLDGHNPTAASATFAANKRRAAEVAQGVFATF